MSIFQYINCFVIKHSYSSVEVVYSSAELDIITLGGRRAYYNNALLISEVASNVSDLDPEYEITACYDEFFTRKLIESDYFAGSRIDYFMHDVVTKSNTKVIKRGYVIGYEIEQNSFAFKLQPLKNFLLNRKINFTYSRSCRAAFGDKLCKINLKDLSVKLGYVPCCDKTKKSCRQYNNIVNFRGE